MSERLTDADVERRIDYADAVTGGCSGSSGVAEELRRARAAESAQAERIRVLEERLRGLTSWADNLLAEAEGQGGTYGFTRTGVRAAITDAQRALKEQP